MGEFASWRHIGELFGGLNTLRSFTDGGRGYSPRADFHVKWHADGRGVVDRFHVTNEASGRHVYYLLGYVDRLPPADPPALTKHAGGRVASSAYPGVDLRPFDALADGFLHRISKAVRQRYEAAEGVEADIAAEEGKEKAKAVDANTFLARRGEAFNKAKARPSPLVSVTVGGATKTLDAKTTLLGMKAPYGAHEELLAAIEAALDGKAEAGAEPDKLQAQGVPTGGSLPTNPPAPTGKQVVQVGVPGHWEVKPLADASGTGRPPGL